VWSSDQQQVKQGGVVGSRQGVIEGIRLGKEDPLDRWAIGDLCIDAISPGSSPSRARG
jgi:hypothetical protein